MGKDLRRMRPSTLGREIQALMLKAQQESNAVFALASDHHETWGAIVERLGGQHALVRRAGEAEARLADAVREATRRYGSNAVTFRSGWPSFLARVDR